MRFADWGLDLWTGWFVFRFRDLLRFLEEFKYEIQGQETWGLVGGFLGGTRWIEVVLEFWRLWLCCFEIFDREQGRQISWLGRLKCILYYRACSDHVG